MEASFIRSESREASKPASSDAAHPAADVKPAEFATLEDEANGPARHPSSSDPVAVRNQVADCSTDTILAATAHPTSLPMGNGAARTARRLVRRRQSDPAKRRHRGQSCPEAAH